MIKNTFWVIPGTRKLKQTFAEYSLIVAFFSLMFSFSLGYAYTSENEGSVKIGVLANRGQETALEMWTQTADYLSYRLPSYSFRIVPLTFEEIKPAVERGEVDFILTNSSIYVEIESYGVSRIATMKNSFSEGTYLTMFGGVIFTRADRKDINRLEDIKGKTFMAVDETSLGGWRVAWRQFRENGIDPYHDFSVLKFGNTHDNVVYAVRDGAVDAGTVRTDILERMALDGKIALNSFRVLNEKKYEGFPFAVSTRLYPEWPFSKVKHTPDGLAQKVAIELLNMPESSPAAKTAKIAGWTIPLDYSPVHEALRELRVGPYKDYGKISINDAIRLYWHWIVLAFSLLFITAGTSVYVIRLNRGLRQIKSALEEAQKNLEQKVTERTTELASINEELEREIAERTHVEEIVRERDERLRLLLSSVQEAIYGVDVQGNCMFCNTACLSMLGYEREEDLLGKNLHYLIHHSYPDGTEYPQEKCRIFGAFRKNQGIYVNDEVFWRADGSSFETEYWASPIIKNNLAIGGVVTFLDITERRKTEKEILKVQKLESLGVLAGGIAHDFNNILTAILGRISMLKLQTSPGDELHSRYKEIENASLRAKDLTKQLITFSRGGAPVRKTASLLNAIRESSLFALRGSNVRCDFLIPDSLWPAEIDEGQISQVVHNLVLNAEQAMPQGGVIEVQADNISLSKDSGLPLEEGKYVKIQIRDRGIGIPPENLLKVFDPYFTTKNQGNGLGLAASYSIIRNHDGYITADSEVGVGTTLTLYLPASEKRIVKERAVETLPLEGTGKVLIMDDEEMVRNVAGEMLKALGYTVEFARDGTEAIAMYNTAKESGHPFHVAIMDLTIPGGMGGKEALQRLRETDPETRAIVSSGYAEDPVMGEYRRYGFSGVLVKPYKLSQLSEAVRRAITSKP